MVGRVKTDVLETAIADGGSSIYFRRSETIKTAVDFCHTYFSAYRKKTGRRATRRFLLLLMEKPPVYWADGQRMNTGVHSQT